MTEKVAPEKLEAILKSLDEAIAEGPWEASNFLRIIGKHLQDIRDGLAGHLHHDEDDEEAQRKVAELLNPIDRTGKREVFVSLYTSDGSNLAAWERIIANLPRQMTSRAIYASEEDAASAARSRENRTNEGYLAIYIDEMDILTVSPEKAIFDRRGKPLLGLKDRAIKLENITRFVHENDIYAWRFGRLVKI